MKLLKIPVDTYEDTLRVLRLEHYPKVLQLFDYNGRKQLAIHLATTIVEKAAFILTSDAVSILLHLRLFYVVSTVICNQSFCAIILNL